MRSCECTASGYANCTSCGQAPQGASIPTAEQLAALRAMCGGQSQQLVTAAPIRVRVLAAQLTPAGATDVTLGVELEQGPQPRFTIERSQSPSGPFSRVASLAESTRTYVDRAIPADRVYYRAVIASGAQSGTASEVVTVHRVARTRYQLERESVPGIPFATSLVGEVRIPSGATAAPLVLFLHGNHGNCRPPDYPASDDALEVREEHTCRLANHTTTPNELGYVYLQEMLAARGFASVSISANALNGRNDSHGWIDERVALIRGHLTRWAQWSRDGRAPWQPSLPVALDLSRVALVGHSRGAEAVTTAAEDFVASPVGGVTVRSVFSIAPTDFHDPTAQRVAHAVLVPSCDGDVDDLSGIDAHDRSRLRIDGHPRVSFVVVGANHNYFNSEWRFDDAEYIGSQFSCGTPQVLSQAQARATAQLLIGDWLADSLRGALSQLPGYVRGERDVPPTLAAWAGRTVDVRSSYSAADRQVIERFEGSARAWTASSYDLSDIRRGFGNRSTDQIPVAALRHELSALRLSARRPATTTFTINGSSAGFSALAIRMAVALGSTRAASPPAVDFEVRVRDANGAVASAPLATAGGLDGPHPQGYPWSLLQTVRIPLTAFAGVDTANLRQVELVHSSPQELWVSDVELARQQ